MAHEVEQLQAQLKQHQETHKTELQDKDEQHKAELAELRAASVPAKEAAKTIKEWEDYAKDVQDQLAEAQAQLQGRSGVSDAPFRAELDLTRAELQEVRSELAAAQHKLVAFEQVKAEDGITEQRAAEAQTKANRLAADLEARNAELVSTRQMLQDAQQQSHDSAQALEALQDELQASTERLLELEGRCREQEQGFVTKVKQLISQTEEHASQYIKDQDSKLREIDLLKEQLHGHGKHGHKRSRDHSDGRDSKRRS